MGTAGLPQGYPFRFVDTVSEPAGAAHVHSFLARPGHQRAIPAMVFTLNGQDFPNPGEDAPRGQSLPKP